MKKLRYAKKKIMLGLSIFLLLLHKTVYCFIIFMVRRKTWTGLPVRESIRMTEDRGKWKQYVHGVSNRRIDDGSRTERNKIMRRFDVDSSNRFPFELGQTDTQMLLTALPAPRR